MVQGRRHQPKIGHGRVPASNELLDYGELNSHALGPGTALEEEWANAGMALPERPSIRRYRMNRVREQLRLNDVDAILISGRAFSKRACVAGLAGSTDQTTC